LTGENPLLLFYPFIMKKKRNKKKLKTKSLNSFQKEKLYFSILIGFALVFGFLMYAIGVNLQKVEVTEEMSPFESSLNKMVSGHPITKMISEIVQKDKRVASFLVAIAKKESNWGKYSPKKNGRDCYNYWGYRGTYNQTPSGYSCFDSPEQAVDVVGNRIGELIDQQIDTPQKMIVWKCGKSCDGHSGTSVKKWISDVDYYFGRIYN